MVAVSMLNDAGHRSSMSFSSVALSLLLVVVYVTLVATTVDAAPFGWGSGGGGGLYSVLGLSRGATTKEVKSAYRKLARSEHPDQKETHTPEEREEVKETFAKILQAYNVLSDPEKRREYDHTGEIPESDGGQRRQPHHDPFAHFFQGGGGHNRARPEPINSKTESFGYSDYTFAMRHKGPQLTLIQFYHDGCFECRLFGHVWDNIYGSSWSSVVRMGRIAVDKQEGGRILHMTGLEYGRPAPVVALIVDGSVWSLSPDLAAELRPHNELGMQRAVTNFVRPFLTDVEAGIVKNGAVFSSVSSPTDALEWLFEPPFPTTATAGDSASSGDVSLPSSECPRGKVVFTPLKDMNVAVAVDLRYHGKVCVAVASEGSQPLRDLLSQTCGRRTSSLPKAEGSGEFLLLFNETALVSAFMQRHSKATVSALLEDKTLLKRLCDSVTVATSGSGFGVKRVLALVESSFKKAVPAASVTSKAKSSRGSFVAEPHVYKAFPVAWWRLTMWRVLEWYHTTPLTSFAFLVLLWVLQSKLFGGGRRGGGRYARADGPGDGTDGGGGGGGDTGSAGAMGGGGGRNSTPPPPRPEQFYRQGPSSSSPSSKQQQKEGSSRSSGGPAGQQTPMRASAKLPGGQPQTLQIPFVSAKDLAGDSAPTGYILLLFHERSRQMLSASANCGGPPRLALPQCVLTDPKVHPRLAHPRSAAALWLWAERAFAPHFTNAALAAKADGVVYVAVRTRKLVAAVRPAAKTVDIWMSEVLDGSVPFDNVVPRECLVDLT